MFNPERMQNIFDEHQIIGGVDLEDADSLFNNN